MMTPRMIGLGLVMVSLQGFVWTAATSWPKNPKVAAFVTLPLFVMFLDNACSHVFWLFHFRSYAPGVVTAVLVVTPTVLFLMVKAVRDRLVPWWYLLIPCVLGVKAVADTVAAGNHVTPEMQSAHLSILRLGTWLFTR